jgi:hypothetical protein
VGSLRSCPNPPPISEPVTVPERRHPYHVMIMDERAMHGDRSGPLVWWAAASAGGVLAAVQLVLLAVTWRAPPANDFEARPSALAYLLVAMMFLVTGLVVVWRRPGNVIGWMLAGIGLTFLLYQTAVQYTLYGLLARSPPLGVGVAAVLTQGLWMPPFGLLPPLLLVYPTGRTLTPSWRWVIRSSIVAVVVGPILVTVALWSTRDQAGAMVVGRRRSCAGACRPSDYSPSRWSG